MRASTSSGANGTGFCDSGLKATGFRVLPDIPAFRANAWVNTSETSVQPLREIVAAGQGVKAAFEALDTDEWWQLETAAEVEICVGACITAPVKRPAISDEVD